jgi:hypothetical protein
MRCGENMDRAGRESWLLHFRSADLHRCRTRAHEARDMETSGAWRAVLVGVSRDPG